MVRWWASTSSCSFFKGVDKKHSAHAAISSKPSSCVALASPRSRSDQRSGGKCRPIVCAMNALTSAHEMLALDTLRRLPRHRRVESMHLIQRQKIFQIMDQHESVLDPGHSPDVLQAGNDLTRSDDVAHRELDHIAGFIHNQRDPAANGPYD